MFQNEMLFCVDYVHAISKQTAGGGVVSMHALTDNCQSISIILVHTLRCAHHELD